MYYKQVGSYDQLRQAGGAQDQTKSQLSKDEDVSARVHELLKKTFRTPTEAAEAAKELRSYGYKYAPREVSGRWELYHSQDAKPPSASEYLEQFRRDLLKETDPAKQQIIQREIARLEAVLRVRNG